MPILQRTHGPEPRVVLCIMPFGTKNGFDFDQLYDQVLKPAIEELGLLPERVDSLYGPQGMLDLIWRSIQRAELVVVDFSTRSVNVGFELALAMALGKRHVIITQSDEDLPTDLRGLNRHLRYSESFFDMRKLEHELVAQLEALRKEPAEEMALIPFIGYAATKVTATVLSVEKEYATVRTADGRIGHMTGADIDYCRFFSDLRKRFKAGDVVEGAFTIDIRTQEPRYTLLAGDENPWPTIAATRPIGTSFAGSVMAVTEAGAFVRVLGRVNGLVPRGAFPVSLPAVGDELEVVVSRLEIDSRRVSLQLATPQRAGSPGSAPAARAGGPRTGPPALPVVGERFEGTVTRIVPQTQKEDGSRSGGYLLIELPGHRRPAMLLLKHMTDDLRADFGEGEVDDGEEMSVQVVEVDQSRGKVLLRDLSEEEAEAGTERPPAALIGD